MGWNSWDCFGVDVTEAEVLANAEYMAEHLLSHGWDTVVVDLAWYGRGLTALGEQYKMQRPPLLLDEWGRPMPNPDLHPSAADGMGFKPLADKVHALGLKFGIHIMRGVPWEAVEKATPIKGSEHTCADIGLPLEGCPWFHGFRTMDMAHPGGQAWYDSLAELWAGWGVDFVKADDMNSWTGEGGSPYRADEVDGLARAIAKAGRPVTLSLSPGAAQYAQVAHMQDRAHMWRISPDFWDDWAALRRMFDHCAKWARFSGPQSWPDADMLPLGRISLRAEVGEPRSTNFTRDEQVTMLTLWAIARSPLMFGGHLPETDADTLALITNDAVIGVNQRSSGGREILRDGNLIAWAAGAEDGGRYVALFNVGEDSLSVDTAHAGIDIGDGSLFDLWSGATADGSPLDIPPHGARLLRVG
ncbi:Alpha-galactosidase A precursor [Tsuneonella dongtanensis]|uniref:Alpha-galactosidase A n=1 Tax=Tsuneonella dongtanensis TaxID=692370 RepID=A0A1B2AB02_9SPHN|nr:glycoside hydrolase family 27 protein [Tsuneonella dongtanensis]ANY19353.1 Alpha-galactosidase A precursor [Tsuneonella dongtanensis]